MARSYFCDHCDSAMAKGGRVTLNIAVSEPHKASLLPSFNKELCPLCYENLMAAIAEALSKPNQVPAARLVQADVGTLIDPRFAFIVNDNVTERALLKKSASSSAGRKRAM
jgi:hypothetical protein